MLSLWLSGTQEIQKQKIIQKKMEKKIKRLGDSQVEASFVVEPERLVKSKEAALKDLGQQVEVPGFRKGKAPADAVEARVGSDRVVSRAAELIIEDSYKRLLKEEELEPITQPQIEISKLALGNPFEFKMVFTVLPDVELPDYKKISAGTKREDGSVTAEEVEDTLKWLQKARPNLKNVKRASKEGDYIEIEFISDQLEKGKVYEDGFIIGKGHLIPGFNEQLIGVSEGENKTFTLTMPDNFKMTDVAGKDVEFSVTIKQVSETEERELNDEFAKEVGEFKTLDELKENIEKGLKTEKESGLKKKLREDILNNLVKGTKIKVPSVLIDRESKSQLEGLKTMASEQLSLSYEEYLEKIQKSEEDLLKGLRQSAEERSKKFLILREIAKQEEVEVTAEEIEAEVSVVLAQYPSPEEAKERIDPQQLRSYTEESIRNEKVFEILENCK